MILGVSLSHESGAALLEGSQLRLAANEERFTRRKGDSDVPRNCLDWIAECLGGGFGGVRKVGVANLIQSAPPPMRSDLADAVLPLWQRAVFRGGLALGLHHPILGTRGGLAVYQGIFRHLRTKRYRRLVLALREGGFQGAVHRYDHHLCHELSAIYTAGWDECLAVTMDCWGDGAAGRVAAFRHGALEQLHVTPMVHSLGCYYLFATNLCGFPQSYHCGKTVGLAAYGQGGRALEYLRSRINFDANQGRIVNRGKFLRNGLHEMRTELGACGREEIAAAVQTVTEEVVTEFVRYWLQRSGMKKLTLAGGLFSNVKLNQRLAALPGLEGIFIHPHMGDGGLPAGAAFAAMRNGLPAAQCPAPARLPNAFLGTELVAEALPDLLRAAGLPFCRPVNLDLEVARRLAQGAVVARVAGSMEYGPRALGNRSILCQATDASINEWLNRKLRRSEFMPFAPMLLREDAAAYLIGYSLQNAHAAEFMTLTYDVTERCRVEAPAVVHVDGTARPQVVDERVNPCCYRILREYKRLTGLSVLINTSFNLHDEPIVCAAEDAIRAFLLSGLDCLALGDYLVGPRAA